jgi:hypothetical protein
MTIVVGNVRSYLANSYLHSFMFSSSILFPIVIKLYTANKKNIDKDMCTYPNYNILNEAIVISVRFNENEFGLI